MLTHLPFNSSSIEQVACGSWWLDEGNPSNDTVGGVMYKRPSDATARFVNPTGGSSGGGSANNRYLQFGNWANNRPVYFNMYYSI
jgi:hypothetical protein